MINPETLKPVSEIATLLPIIGMAFSAAIKKLIGIRDNWTCTEEGCGRSYQDGWMVHAAHDPEHHLKTDPIYDTVEAGSIKCVEHHLKQHLKGTNLPKCQNDYAVRQLQNTDQRTIWWRKK